MLSPLQRLLNYARPYRPQIIRASCFSVANKFFDILPEVLIGVAVDAVVKRENSLLAQTFGVPDLWSQIIGLALATAAIWILESWTEYRYSVHWRNLAQTLQHEMRLDGYRHVQNLPLSYLENHRSGNLLSILSDDINQMERFLNHGANDLIQVFTSSLLISLIFFLLTPGVAFLALLPIPFILYGAFWFQGRLASRYTKVREQAGFLNGLISNNLSGIATIKAFTAESYEAKLVEQASANYRSANNEAIRFASAITPVIRMAVMAGFIATLMYGGWLVLHNQLAVGAYSVLIFLTQRLLWPLTRLAEVSDLYQRSMASIRRVLDLLDAVIPQEIRGLTLTSTQAQADIQLQRVTFSYTGGPIVLPSLDLKIPAQKTVALVGTTGSGKSSIVKLLLRFYEPQQGKILLGETPFNDFDLQSLRAHIGFVSQDVFLIDASIAENIAYGRRNASAEEIQAAAQAAEAHAFITALPEGYQTQVGERGQKLSGGQKQRIAIARAILKDPPILILDEATAAVDNETEAAIQRSLATITRNRTTIIIAHRLSTIRHADLIYVLEHGKILESGTHQSLLSQQGIYAGLWRLQTGEIVAS